MVFHEYDESVWGDPVAHAEQERIEDGGKVISAGDSCDDVDEDTDRGPDEAGDLDGPVPEDLSAETERVIVGDVVGDNREGEEGENEFTESAGWFNAHPEKTPDTGVGVGVGPILIDKGGGHGSGTEPFEQIEGAEETEVGPAESRPFASLGLHVDVVVHSERAPCNRESKDSGAKAENACHLGTSTWHGEIDEGVTAKSRHEGEHGDHQEPAVSFVEVDDFVSEESDEEGNEGDEDDADCKGAFSVRDRVDDLSAGNGIDHAPSDAGDDVDAGQEHGTVPTEGVPGECDGSKAGQGTKSSHVRRSDDSQEVEKQDGDKRIPPAHVKQSRSQAPESKGTDCQVGGHPSIQVRHPVQMKNVLG